MAYTRVNWENYPSTNTPRNATNLNVMDAGIDDVDTRLSTVESDINNLNGKILWTNPNPTANFNAQTITLNSDDYDELEFIFTQSPSLNNDTSLNIFVLKKCSTKVGQFIGLDGNSYASYRFRNIEFIDETHYKISGVSTKQMNEKPIYPDDSGTRLIPQYIIGHKKGLFS